VSGVERQAEAGVEKTGKVSDALEVTVADAVLLALENNKALLVERYTPKIRRTLQTQAEAAFDADFTVQGSFSRQEDEQPITLPSESSEIQLGIQKLFPLGTEIGVTGSAGLEEFSGSPNIGNARLGLSVSQPLMRGFGTDVNLALVRQARLDVLSSQYELRGFAESLVAQVEEAYWDYSLARQNLDIIENSLSIAQRQLDETQERVRVGSLAEIDLAAAEAEVASRKQNLIDAKSSLDKARLRFLSLLGPDGSNNLTNSIKLKDEPSISEITLGPVEDHVKTALKFRPDLNQAILLVNRGQLDVARTRNGLLPLMNLFINLGKTGYADSFGGSLKELPKSNSYDAQVGLNFEAPFGNRRAKAGYERAILTREQSLEAVSNLAQLVEVDVRSAYIELERAKEQVAASAVTLKLQEEKLKAETEKFRIGKSTTLLVAQAQRDLMSSQLTQTQAVASYLKDLVELLRVEGTLLQSRGISSPGAEPVKPSVQDSEHVEK
jgi:outer membrane protein TolC